MGRGGHNAKPTEKHKAEGTYNATKHRDRLTFPVLDAIPKPPGYFTKEQVVKWNLFCTMLKRDGMLSDTYLELLERYCNAWLTWWKAHKEVDEKGITFDTGSGQTKQNPAVAIEKEMLALMLRILQDFGYTPRSAMAIKMPGGKDEKDPMEEFLNGKREN